MKKAKLLGKVSEEEVGGPPETIGDQFFNEMTKRELGRLECKKAGCTHFMSMDTDEFYITRELAAAKELILKNDYDATACRMRIIFKEPIYEYFPYDDVNAVPLIYKIKEDSVFKLAEPAPVLLDPTRKPTNCGNFHLFPRHIVEMYHMSFVRKSMRTKVNNVSNKANYNNVEEFLEKFDKWKGPEMGILHPHPNISQLFSEIRIIDNYFNVDINQQCRLCCISHDLKRCSRCKNVRYCSGRCQAKDWENHKLKCHS